MAVEMNESCLCQTCRPSPSPKKFFQHLGKKFRVVNSTFGNVSDRFFGRKSGVLGKETKDDAIEKPRDAEILLLRYVHFLAGFSVGQFDASRL